MLYHSTRDEKDKKTGAEALLEGLAPDGGLYVPDYFPQLCWDDFSHCSYEELASLILSLYFTDPSTGKKVNWS